MARGYCQCLLKCLCITVPPTYSVTTYFPHHVFRHHVFPPPRIPSPRISPITYSVTTYFLHHVSRSSPCDHDDDCDRRAERNDTTCFWSATDSNRIIIIYLARPLTYCGRDIWNCSKGNFLFELAVETRRRMRIT